MQDVFDAIGHFLLFINIWITSYVIPADAGEVLHGCTVDAPKDGIQYGLHNTPSLRDPTASLYSGYRIKSGMTTCSGKLATQTKIHQNSGSTGITGLPSLK
jgi:hypothetical protein